MLQRLLLWIVTCSSIIRTGVNSKSGKCTVLFLEKFPLSLQQKLLRGKIWMFAYEMAHNLLVCIIAQLAGTCLFRTNIQLVKS